MALHFNELANVLTSPTDTYKRLKKDVEMADGIKLYLIAMAIFSVIYAVFVSLWMSPFAYGSAVIIGGFLGAIMQVIIGFFVFLVTAFIAAKLTKSISRGKGDFERTVGLYGYYTAAMNLLVVIPFFILLILSSLLIGSAINPAIAVPFLLLLIIGGIGLFIWSLILGGKAVAAANDVNTVSGIVALFLAGIILMGIIFLIFFVLGLFVIMATVV